MQRRLLLIVGVAAKAYEVEPEVLAQRVNVRAASRSRTLYCLLGRRFVRTLGGQPVPTTLIGLTIERDHTTVLHHLAFAEHMMASTGRNGEEQRFRAEATLAMANLQQAGWSTRA